MSRCFFLIAIWLTAWAVAAGQTLHCSRPGELAASRQVSAAATALTVTGSIDASDLDYLANAIADVKLLDLSGAEIAPYKGKRVGVGITSAPANTLPAYIFAGLKAGRLLLPESLKAIGDGAFLESTIGEVALPQGLDELGAYAFAQCRNLASVDIPGNVRELCERTFEGCSALGEVSLPPTLTAIGDRAFLGCSSLQKISFPAALISIGDESFAHSGLEDAVLGECGRLKNIGKRAFAGCESLASVALPDGATELGESTFFGCSSLGAVKLPLNASAIPDMMLAGAANVSSLVLPRGIREVGSLAMVGMTGLREIDATTLASVPETGADVWAGVNQPEVLLRVRPGLEDDFHSTAQWQEFSINKSSVNATVADTDEEIRIEATFEGYILDVASTRPMKGITLFGIGGAVFLTTDKLNEQSVSIDTSRYPDAFFIVSVTFCNRPGSSGIKLMRHI